MKNQDKTSTVLAYLNAELTKLDAGEKLPSTRQIQTVCGVSQAVATRALDELQALNLIEARPQSGYYKTDRSAQRQLHLVFMQRHDPALSDVSSFYYETLSRMIMELSLHGFAVHFHVVDNLAELPFYPLYTVKKQRLGLFPQSTIITFAIRREQLAEVEFMESHGFRFLHWLPNFAEPYRNTVVVDDRLLIRTQLELLQARGLRRIAHLHHRTPERWNRAADVRYEQFCHLAIERQLEVLPQYPALFNPYRQEQSECDAAVERMFRKAAAPPEAILLALDNTARNLYRSMRRIGVEPGRDVAVLGTNDSAFCAFLDPELTSVGVDRQAGIEYLKQAIDRISEGEELPPWLYPLHTSLRQTLI